MSGMKTRPMKRAALLIAILTAALAPLARADYAVLRSGLRLHITGYETVGDRVRLTVDGGLVEMPADAIVSVEPEDVFPANPIEPAPTGPFGNLIRAAAEKIGRASWR